MTIDDLKLTMHYNAYVATLRGGGEVPKELKGFFTGRGPVQLAINKYNSRIAAEAKRPKRVPKVKLTKPEVNDGKTKSTS